MTFPYITRQEKTLSELYPQDEPECLEHILRAIKTNRRDAIRVGEDFLADHGPFVSAHTYFQLALAYALVRNQAGFKKHRYNAWLCADFTEEIDGDFDRDEAIMQIKLGNKQKAQQLLSKALSKHANHPAKRAADHIALGKLHAAEGNLDAALSELQLAENKLLRYAKKKDGWDAQYLRNARWHLMLLVARQGQNGLFISYADLLLEGETLETVDGLVNVVEDIPRRRRLASALLAAGIMRKPMATAVSAFNL